METISNALGIKCANKGSEVLSQYKPKPRSLGEFILSFDALPVIKIEVEQLKAEFHESEHPLPAVAKETDPIGRHQFQLPKKAPNERGRVISD